MKYDRNLLIETKPLSIRSWLTSRSVSFIVSGLTGIGLIYFLRRNGTLERLKSITFEDLSKFMTADLYDRLTDPAVVHIIAQATIPQLTTTAVNLWLSRSGMQEEQEHLRQRMEFADAERLMSEIMPLMQDHNYGLAEQQAMRAFNAYHACYLQQPSMHLAERLELLQYLRALALAHMNKFGVPKKESTMITTITNETIELSANDNAFIILENIIQYNERHFEAINLRGFIYFHGEYWEEAIKDFTRSLLVFPNQTTIYVFLQYAKAMISKDKILKNDLYQDILIYVQISDSKPLFLPKLIEIYAKCNLALKQYTYAFAHLRLGIDLWRHSPVYHEQVRLFYKLACKNLKALRLILSLQKLSSIEIPSLRDTGSSGNNTHLTLSDINRLSEQYLALSMFKCGVLAIPNWTIQNMLSDGNCFYHAVAHQLELLQLRILEQKPKEQRTHSWLRANIAKTQLSQESNGKWADDQTIDHMVRFLCVIIAIIDLRSIKDGFVTYFVGENDELITHHDDPNITLPDRQIIRLAATGKHYMSVLQHPILTRGAITEAYDSEQKARPLTALSNIKQCLFAAPIATMDSGGDSKETISQPSQSSSLSSGASSKPESSTSMPQPK